MPGTTTVFWTNCTAKTLRSSSSVRKARWAGHRIANVIEETLAAFPDMRVHNDPYDVQFGQGQWTVAMGRVSGTFTKPMQTPEGGTIAPTGKRFETFFTTIAKWKNDQIVEEYVMLDPRDIMKQVVP